MATLLPVPTNVPEAVSTGYQRQNSNFYAVAMGHMILGLTQINTHLVPSIMADSIIEVNGGLYKATEGNEDISGTPTNNAVNYIYAVPNENTASFEYGSTPAPLWNPAKGGWYNGNNRAIAKFYYSSNGPIYGNKVILDSYNAMSQQNSNFVGPTSGGSLVHANSQINMEAEITLQVGVYRVELKAGTGGSGGSAFAGRGGAGAAGEGSIATFQCFFPVKAYISCGGNGNDGKPGMVNNIGNAAGGGGCTGGCSYCYVPMIDWLLVAMGGSGGGGASDDVIEDDIKFFGGGGGGGYGIGAAGAVIDDIYPGRGGYNGIGGDGARGHAWNGDPRFGGGGSGFIRGSSDSLHNGGGYGMPGGTAVSYIGIQIVSGGNSRTLRPTSVREDSSLYGGRYLYNAYQGGGAGSSTYSDALYSEGGSGLRSTSSGYARIYRVG